MFEQLLGVDGPDESSWHCAGIGGRVEVGEVYAGCEEWELQRKSVSHRQP